MPPTLQEIEARLKQARAFIRGSETVFNDVVGMLAEAREAEAAQPPVTEPPVVEPPAHSGNSSRPRPS